VTPLPLGNVVADGLGLTFAVRSSPYALELGALAGLALRENPKRAQLVVSTVLGKHLPVAPRTARGAALLLAALIAGKDGLSTQDLHAPGDPVGRFPGAPVVLGYCETATSLGHLVADCFAGADYAHTTRRTDPSVPVVLTFQEEHSHAVDHALQLTDPGLLDDPARPLVLVDDELTTGRTALNTIEELHRRAPHDRYVVAALLDVRSAAAVAAFDERAAGLGVEVEVVSLLAGALTLPDDVAARVSALRTTLEAAPAAPVPAGAGRVRVLSGAWPAGLPLGGRTGTSPADRPAQAAALAGLADLLAPRLGGRTLVLGTEELMWAPVRLADLLPGEVVFQSTTRSPVLAADVPGYAVRRAVHFPSPDEPGRPSRLHGLPDEAYDDVVVLVDAPDWQPLAEALRPWGAVHVVEL
jgi:hypothetical protein